MYESELQPELQPAVRLPACLISRVQLVSSEGLGAKCVLALCCAGYSRWGWLLRRLPGPSGSGDVEAVADQQALCSFDGAGRGGPARGEMRVSESISWGSGAQAYRDQPALAGDRGAARVTSPPGSGPYSISARTVETRPRTSSTLSVITACMDSPTSKV